MQLIRSWWQRQRMPTDDPWGFWIVVISAALNVLWFLAIGLLLPWQ
jgi:hypothetical protein